jgi:2-oxoglutarate ferredoxin oxidoreductase subunit delta
MPKIEVDAELCKCCELCLAVCPSKILEMSEKLNTKGYHFAQQTDENKCTGCKLCAIMCPDAAISVFK